MASWRKHATDETLTQDAKYNERWHKICFERSIAARTEEAHNYWMYKQNAAREKARASRAELERRKNNV